MNKKKDIISQAFKNIKPEHQKFANISVDIASHIHDKLEEKGWTKSDLAQAMGRQNSEISKWLSGTHNFTLQTLTKIEAILGDDLILSRKQAFDRFSTFSTGKKDIDWRKGFEPLHKGKIQKDKNKNQFAPAA